MTAADIELRAALQALAGEIAGITPVAPARGDPPGGGFAEAYRRHRDELLLGAALLTGHGDAAQDALHAAAGRVMLADLDPAATVARLRRGIVRQARRGTAAASDQ